MIAGPRWQRREAGAVHKVGLDVQHLPVLERLDQRAGEYDAATPSFRQSLIDQLVGPRLHGGGDFRAETASQRRLLACDEITIEPGRAIGADLLAKRDRKRTRLNSSH